MTDDTCCDCGGSLKLAYDSLKIRCELPHMQILNCQDCRHQQVELSGGAGQNYSAGSLLASAAGYLKQCRGLFVRSSMQPGVKSHPA